MQLFDLPSAAIVLGGTLAATLLRCGWRDCWCAIQAVANLFARPFDIERVRAELAVQVQDINRNGLLRAEPHHSGDGEFDELSEALIRHRSIRALYDEHERHRSRRSALAGTAGLALAEAADLAPVLGLAGTLLALGGLASSSIDGQYGAAIGAAVTTTFYGLVAANFLFAPLSTAVERRARAEERRRQELLEWLAASIERAEPGACNTMQRNPSAKVAA
jgi:chemotaxis protein MotA